jgi:CheY-like chemotaxis protein
MKSNAQIPRRVLVIDDDLDGMQSLATLFRHMGHEVEFAINGYAALRIATAFRPDVVLLDLGLPGLDGFEVCRQIKAAPGLAHARVIAVTAYAGDEHRVRARAAGCEMHIVKPYDPGYVLAVVNEVPGEPLA